MPWFDPMGSGMNLEKLRSEFTEALEAAENREETAAVKSNFLGKEGAVSALLKSLKDLDPAQRKETGKKLHALKAELEQAVTSRFSELERAEMNRKLEAQWSDISARRSLFDRGLSAAGYHPLISLQRELEEIFISMGFEVLDGPHIEDEWHNFTALNIPEHHPARDLQDTFWFEDKQHLLRTHTSCIQIRGMKDRKPPFRFIGPGQVFRCERTDALHDFSFFQLEGLLVDKDINVSHLLYFAERLFEGIFEEPVEIRTRPSYFPFVEPGLEIDMRRSGSGSHTDKWVEILGCGMVHPNVLSAVGIDPQEYSGFAFGLGIDRLLIMRYGIEDIRHLRSGDLRFVSQFFEYR